MEPKTLQEGMIAANRLRGTLESLYPRLLAIDFTAGGKPFPGRDAIVDAIKAFLHQAILERAEELADQFSGIVTAMQFHDFRLAHSAFDSAELEAIIDSDHLCDDDATKREIRREWRAAFADGYGATMRVVMKLK